MEPAGAVEPTFEEALATVEEAVEKLERGQLSLDASLAEYERGLKALRRCYGVLGEAQRRIEVLSGSLTNVEGAVWKPAQASTVLRDAVQALDAELGGGPEEGP